LSLETYTRAFFALLDPFSASIKSQEKKFSKLLWTTSYEQPSVCFLIHCVLGIFGYSGTIYSCRGLLTYLLTYLVDCKTVAFWCSTSAGRRYSGAAQRTRLQHFFHSRVPQGFQQRQGKRDSSHAGRCFTVLEQVPSSTDVLVSWLLAYKMAW